MTLELVLKIEDFNRKILRENGHSHKPAKKATDTTNKHRALGSHALIVLNSKARAPV